MLKRLLVGILIIGAGVVLFNQIKTKELIADLPEKTDLEITEENFHPMAIEGLKQREFLGSEIIIEETLAKGVNYSRYIASYLSEGNKIYGLLTIPDTNKPEAGYPIIAFVHGYIDPQIYQTTSRYVAYQDGLARNGFITYKIDLRGHGNSEGEAVNGHFSEAYVVDTLNSITSLKKLPEANANNIGIWGHSNGGEIGLRSMVVSPEIKAGVFWAGVVGSFEGMLEIYNNKISFLDLKREVPELVKQNDLPSKNPDFWQKIDPYAYLNNIGGEIQLHHGTTDESVPIETSQELVSAMENIGQEVEYFEYPGADHNLSNPAFNSAMERTVEFFKKQLSEE